MVCTFFGHRNVSDNIEVLLHTTLTELIENYSVDTFFVGNQGGFDNLVRKELKKLTKIYPHIKYTVVLAYFPEKYDTSDVDDYSDTIFPNGLENVPRKFAIDKRNRMMIEWADIVITYVSDTFGGAYKFKKISERKGKKVINLLL